MTRFHLIFIKYFWSILFIIAFWFDCILPFHFLFCYKSEKKGVKMFLYSHIFDHTESELSYKGFLIFVNIRDEILTRFSISIRNMFEIRNSYVISFAKLFLHLARTLNYMIVQIKEANKQLKQKPGGVYPQPSNCPHLGFGLDIKVNRNRCSCWQS